jgi:hypothetical protein
VATRLSPLIALCGLVMAGLLWELGRIHGRLEANPGLYVPRYLVLLGLYFLGGSLCRRHAAPEGAPPRSRRPLILILGFAVLFRLLAVFQFPSLSTDLFRYLWDGRASAHGVNPYAYPPSARQMGRLDPLHSGGARRIAVAPPPAPSRWLYGERGDPRAIAINHPTWVTMYPPLSQRVFGLLYRLSGNSLWAFKLMLMLADLGCIALLLALLRRARYPLEAVVWYAWHPLPILEVSATGHQDVLGVLFALAAMLLAAGSLKPALGFATGIASGLSLMAKGYLLPALPVLGRRRPFLFAAGLVPTVALLAYPYFTPGSQIMVGINQYAGNRLRNAGPYALADGLYSLLTPDHFRWARLTMLGLLALTTLLLAWKPARSLPEMVSRSVSAMGFFFLFSHTVYPWYGVWLVPLFVFQRHPVWLAYTALLPLAYLNPLPGKGAWAPVVEYTVVLGLLAYTLGTRRWNALLTPDRGGGDSPEK